MAYDLTGLRELYPFESHYLEVDGLRMHYVDEGSGATVVMLHGNPTWSFYYRGLIKALRDQYRVVVPDHMGCGLSDKPSDYPYTLSTHIDNVEKLIGQLGLSDISLVVHDWGGAIGFGWAVRHPELVRRFVVFNTAAFMGPCPFRIRVCRWPVFGDIAVRGLNAFARCAMVMACKNRSLMTSEVKRGYLLPYNSFANRIATLRFVQDIPLSRNVPSYMVLKEIETSLAQLADRPMIILWGARDFCFNDWYLRQWTARFPDADVHRFADAGHYVVEDAHDQIVPLIQEFLAQHG
ncbi:MAG: alpha/beta fold hydrolase [Phycisphaerales bacterium]|nr:MAG: alpha/beta fold hydrolase [Phycisphaerales bacterium]